MTAARDKETDNRHGMDIKFVTPTQMRPDLKLGYFMLSKKHKLSPYILGPKFIDQT